MTQACDEIEPELVAYHFGLMEGAARDAVEVHLSTCSSCVRAFVGMKRAIELGESEREIETARPSRRARERLRLAVVREVTQAEPRRWWERPVAFALAASIVLAAGAATHAVTSGPGAPPYSVGKTAP